ncbi:MAG: hypothetical protein HON47_02595 [Candidatus Diapherotrites archaeon]|jgi:predicted Fe-Mo cluster-binding NifX family protein|uniref:Dinitrogenase iron-molybdenum cofactor biosynthesis domain-containing protein n=1 Tax=Candidatus Iainarchaeum sp. TaxID=3101447 RepID=A0A8T5GFY5_9ARCH|nr:hypothetical protein [Candidatus Diapherotrites archaeon]MBT7241656.1 hypothetical protein [Candidatus Diapherotrites archaeon]
MKNKITTKGSAPLNTMPLFIGIILIIIIVVIALVIVVVLPIFSSNEIDFDKTNDFDCPSVDDLKVFEKIALLANGEGYDSNISNGNAKFIQIYSTGNLIEVAQNAFLDEENSEQKIASVLSEKGVSAIALSNPSVKMKSEIKKAGINCYSVSGPIFELFGNKLEEINDPNAYCKKLDEFDLIIDTKVAVSTDALGNYSVISPKNALTPYFNIYEEGKIIETITNTAMYSINPEKEVATLLHNKGVETIVVGISNPEFEVELEKNGITCYKTSKISIIVPE